MEISIHLSARNYSNSISFAFFLFKSNLDTVEPRSNGPAYNKSQNGDSGSPIPDYIPPWWGIFKDTNSDADDDNDDASAYKMTKNWGDKKIERKKETVSMRCN